MPSECPHVSDPEVPTIKGPPKLEGGELPKGSKGCPWEVPKPTEEVAGSSEQLPLP